MADYHVMTGSQDGNSFTVVAHFAVPNINNEVGVNYRTALIQHLGGEQPSACPFISQAEQDAMNAGEVYERTYAFHTHPGETAQQKVARLDSLHGLEKTRILDGLGKQLSYWGYSRNIP